VRILFLSPRQSLPARNGAKLREYHFLRALGNLAEVSYLYFAEPGTEPLTTTDLPFCREVLGVPKPRPYGYVNTALGILGKTPLTVLNYTSAAMSAALNHMMDGSDFDVLHLDGVHMSHYTREALKRKSSLKLIFNWHNIESEALRRYSETTTSAARRWYARHTATNLERVEKHNLESAFGHIVCSDREKEHLQRIVPSSRVAVVENGVDIAHFAHGSETAAPGLRIVFVGAMDYFPNSDAAIFFAKRIWPEVRGRMNGAELLIVGSNPGPGVLALGEVPGVKVTGMVPDVRPFYHGALAAVVPLRTGGGTRLKILEAMAASVPVVSTPLGAEGLDVADGENLLLVDAGDVAGWADRLVSLAASPGLRERLTAAGLRLVQSRYDWNILGAKLCATYKNWLAESER
jgi:glycosyltransferase involved in cell wall biosynthesis